MRRLVAKMGNIATNVDVFTTPIFYMQPDSQTEAQLLRIFLRFEPQSQRQYSRKNYYF